MSVCLSVGLWQFKTPTFGCPGDFCLNGISLILACNDTILVFSFLVLMIFCLFRRQPTSYPKAIWQRWWNSNFDGCLFLAFFSISLLHATKKFDNFFLTIVCCTLSLRQTEFWFVTLSHCKKYNFCLSHWVTATNKINKCYQKVPKNRNKMS